MSVWDRTEWQGGFPFSPSRLRVKGGAMPRVTQPGIPDDGMAPETPARTERPWALTRRPTAQINLPDALAIRATPAMRRFAPRRASLRLVPLGAFSWGSREVPTRPRTRPEHVLLHVTHGAMRVDFPRDHLILQPGGLCFIPAGTAFAARPRSDAEGQVLLVSPELCTGMDPAFPDHTVSGWLDHGSDALQITLQDMAEDAQADPDPKALNCHLNLLAMRLSRLDPARDAGEDQHPAPADRPLVDRFIGMASADLGACLTLADMAQDLGTTLTQLDRACIEARGRRAIELINELRLERAAEMLRHTDRAPAWIAKDLGYATQTHMTRAFVAATGRTPETYRAQMR
ncbi:AraC family transcriptional regulator [Paracoccus sp. 1_MG-2023]|uniref:helix-turn-helix domain-containing protein n=1 Tax=unclassified Paracoccus (in: a-proteobacteria) TaxID=2688777 RepID=UPI001C095134|nr:MULTISPECIES: AraC family transcriptional regulator [unclassified Paracoccus (in: a-proteobacteria)]MBU2958552.1 AraC family transcriptional regulator [Paracoccus sp. C2R09]MDO6667545.1 AraC family transcriptional regulator [Paracoccus sp. 1_MG-2023]